MTFIESEYELAMTRPEKRMFVVIQNNGMKTLR